MSLGVLPSDARAQNIDLSAIEANAKVRRQPTISSDDLDECCARTQASPRSPESEPDGRMQSRRTSVTFEDELPGTPITDASSVQSAALSQQSRSRNIRIGSSPESSTQDKRQSTSEVSAPAPKSNVQPHRRATNEAASPSRCSPPGETPRPLKGLKSDYKRSDSSSPPERPFQKAISTTAAAKEPAELRHDPRRSSRRFSILFGTLQIPPESLPSACPAEHDPAYPRERRKPVYQNSGLSLTSLADFDGHIKHMARLDFVYATLSLGGLGMAVSRLLGK